MALDIRISNDYLRIFARQRNNIENEFYFTYPGPELGSKGRSPAISTSPSGKGGLTLPYVLHSILLGGGDNFIS